MRGKPCARTCSRTPHSAGPGGGRGAVRSARARRRGAPPPRCARAPRAARRGRVYGPWETFHFARARQQRLGPSKAPSKPQVTGARVRPRRGRLTGPGRGPDWQCASPEAVSDAPRPPPPALPRSARQFGPPRAPCCPRAPRRRRKAKPGAVAIGHRIERAVQRLARRPAPGRGALAAQRRRARLAQHAPPHCPGPVAPSLPLLHPAASHDDRAGVRAVLPGRRHLRSGWAARVHQGRQLVRRRVAGA
jgi:hypothetical protein